MVLDESSPEHVIRFVAPILALAPLDRPSKFERYTMHNLRGKRELITIELTPFEKVIQKSAAIALRVAVARNKARYASLVFDGDLHKLAVAQKTVHARVIRARRCRTRGPVLPLQFRLRARKHQSQKNETRRSQRAEMGCVARHAHIGTLSIAVIRNRSHCFWKDAALTSENTIGAGGGLLLSLVRHETHDLAS